jgi:hypothetical protein
VTGARPEYRRPVVNDRALLEAIYHQQVTLLRRLIRLSEQSSEIQQDITDLETHVSTIQGGVQTAVTLIQQLEANQGQPVDPAILAQLKQAVSDVGGAAQAVAGLATTGTTPAS